MQTRIFMSRNEFDWMREVQDFSNRLKNYFENFDQSAPASAAPSGIVLPADLLELDDAYRVDIEIPGMQKEDILITMAGNAVEISGEKRAMRPENARTLHGGRTLGSFRKQIELPDGGDVDLSRVAAAYENGVLRITLPKRAKDPGKSIPIA
jgi:HSP20 family protein